MVCKSMVCKPYNTRKQPPLERPPTPISTWRLFPRASSLLPSLQNAWRVSCEHYLFFCLFGWKGKREGGAEGWQYDRNRAEKICTHYYIHWFPKVKVIRKVVLVLWVEELQRVYVLLKTPLVPPLATSLTFLFIPSNRATATGMQNKQEERGKKYYKHISTKRENKFCSESHCYLLFPHRHLFCFVS